MNGILSSTGIDETGHRYGRLTVQYYVDPPRAGLGAHWMCRCACGKRKIFRGTHLRRWRPVSCGCSQVPYGSRKVAA